MAATPTNSGSEDQNNNGPKRDTALGRDVHPVLERDTAPDSVATDAYDIDSDVEAMFGEGIVKAQLRRVDTVYEIPPEHTSTILDAILRAEGPVAMEALYQDTAADGRQAVEDAVFVLENRNLIESRVIDGRTHVALHHGGLDAVRRARRRDQLTVEMCSDRLDRDIKSDPLAGENSP